MVTAAVVLLDERFLTLISQRILRSVFKVCVRTFVQITNTWLKVYHCKQLHSGGNILCGICKYMYKLNVYELFQGEQHR